MTKTTFSLAGLTLLLMSSVPFATKAQQLNTSNCGCIAKTHLLRPVPCSTCPPKQRAKHPRRRTSKTIVRYRIIKKVIIVKKIIPPDACDPCSQPAINTIIDDPSIGRPQKIRRNP